MPKFEAYLFTVIQQNNADKLKKLLALEQYDPQARNEQGRTLLYHAIALGYQACAEVLLDQGMPFVWDTPNGQTLLHEAILSHDLSLFRYTVTTLQQHLPDYQWQQLLQHLGSTGYTPIALTIVEDQAPMAEFFLQEGADIFAFCESGVNFLTLAIQQQHPGLLELFLKQGLNCAAPDRHGQLPLSYALAQLAEAKQNNLEPSDTLIAAINTLLGWGAALDYPPALLRDLPAAIQGPRNSQQLLDWVKTLKATDYIQRYAIFIAVKTARFSNKNSLKDSDFLRLENFLTERMPGSLQLHCLDEFTQAVKPYPHLKNLILSHVKTIESDIESPEQNIARQQALRECCATLPQPDQQKLLGLANAVEDFFTQQQLPDYLLAYFLVITTNNHSALKIYLQQLWHLRQELSRNGSSTILGRGWLAQPVTPGVSRLDEVFWWSVFLTTAGAAISLFIYLLVTGTKVTLALLLSSVIATMLGVGIFLLFGLIYLLVEDIAEHNKSYRDCSIEKLIPAHQQALAALVFQGKQLLEPAVMRALEKHWLKLGWGKISDLSTTLIALIGRVKIAMAANPMITNQNFQRLVNALVQMQTPSLYLSTPTPLALSQVSIARGFFASSEHKWSVVNPYSLPEHKEQKQSAFSPQQSAEPTDKDLASSWLNTRP